MKMTKIKTTDEARQKAINFQNWQSNKSLYYSEVIEYSNYFENLGKEFNLTDEFKENAII